jgi:hypothetical protein
MARGSTRPVALSNRLNTADQLGKFVELRRQRKLTQERLAFASKIDLTYLG